MGRCTVCGMFVPRPDTHQTSQTCQRLRTRRANEEAAAQQAAAEATRFYVNGGEIERVSRFCYLGRILAENDDDTDCIRSQLRKARARWTSIARALKREGADAHIMSRFYLAVVQAVLLYGADSWAVSDRNMGALERFHKRAVRHITGCHIQRNAQGIWSYPDHAHLLRRCGLWPLRVYVERRRGTLRKYLEDHKSELLDEVGDLSAPARDPHRVLWWRQPWITRERMADMQIPAN